MRISTGFEQDISFGVMIDSSRNAVMRVNEIKRLIDTIIPMGYNTLYLYIEDTYEIESEPYFGRNRGRYTKAELKELNDYGKERNFEIIPCIQTLAHLNAIFRWPKYQKIRDNANIVMVDDERTYDLIDKMFAAMRECFDTENINIGMDEAHTVGLGKYLDKYGYQDKTSILSKHLERVLQIAQKYSFKPTMWSDMFIRPCHHGEYYPIDPDFNALKKQTDKIPEGVKLCYWDYENTTTDRYDTMFNVHDCFNREVSFAGGAVSWLGFAPKNEKSFSTILPAMRSCRKNKIKTVLIAMWGDDGGECSFFSMLPALLYAIEVYKGNENINSIKQKFLEYFNISWDEFMLLELPNHIGDNRDGNLSKYILFQDLFMGYYDYHVNNITKRTDFLGYAEKLRKVSMKAGDYGYLFSYMQDFCIALHHKFDLGIRTRTAYKNDDKNALQQLYEYDYGKFIEALKSFYKTFKSVWMKENKPQGFDIQDVRFGGLIMRTEHLREVLRDYCNRKIDKIEELEDEYLKIADREDCGFIEHWYYRVVSGNIFSHGLEFRS